MEDTFREGQEKEEQQDKEKIKAEDNAIEMSEDFDGQMHDGEEREPGRNGCALPAPVWIWTFRLNQSHAHLSGKDDDDDDSSDEEEDELDKKMGDLGDGQTDTLDERLWGGEEDEEDEEASEKEEESGQGMDQVQRDIQGEHHRWVVVLCPLNTCATWFQGESELVAKDDNLDAADPNKDEKTKDKDQQMDTEEKEKINEQGDQVTFIALLI